MSISPKLFYCLNSAKEADNMKNNNKVKVSVFVKQSELEEINAIINNLEDTGFSFNVSSICRKLIIEGLKSKSINKDIFN